MINWRLCGHLRALRTCFCFGLLRRPTGSTVRPTQAPASNSNNDPPSRQQQSYQKHTERKRKTSYQSYEMEHEKPNTPSRKNGKSEQEQALTSVPRSREALLREINNLNATLSQMNKQKYEPLGQLAQAFWYFVEKTSTADSEKRQILYKKAFEVEMKHELSSYLADFVSQIPNLGSSNLRRINKLLKCQVQMCFREVQDLKQQNAVKHLRDSVLRNVLKNIRGFLIFLDSSDPPTLYHLTVVYEYLIVIRKERRFFNSEMNGLLCLFMKIIASPNLGQIGMPGLTMIIYFFSKYSKNLSSVVFGKLHSIINRTITAYPQWYQNTLSAKSIFHSIAKDSTVSPVIRESMMKAFQWGAYIADQKRQTIYFTNLLKSAMLMKLIDAQTMHKSYPHIVRLIEDNPLEYKSCALTFMRASWWNITKYWTTLLKRAARENNNLSTEQNAEWNTILVCLELLRDQMDPAIYSLYDSIIQNSPKLLEIKTISSQKLMKNYLRQFYSDKINELNFFQICIWNLFRNIGVQCQFEAGIGPFEVDMIVNGKLIIEADGPDHYVFDTATNSYYPTLNTEFKRKMLHKHKQYNFVHYDIISNKLSAAHLVKKLHTDGLF